MGIKLKLVIIFFVICVVSIIIDMIKKEKLELKYSLSWLFTAVMICILSIFPEMISVIASMIGVSTPVNAIFFLGFLFIIIICFSLTIVISKNTTKIARLSQELSLLKSEIDNKSKDINSK